MSYAGKIDVMQEENPRAVYFSFNESGNFVSVKDMKGRIIFKFINTNINVKDIRPGQTYDTECYNYEPNGRDDVFTFMEVED